MTGTLKTHAIMAGTGKNGPSSTGAMTVPMSSHQRANAVGSTSPPTTSNSGSAAKHLSSGKRTTTTAPSIPDTTKRRPTIAMIAGTMKPRTSLGGTPIVTPISLKKVHAVGFTRFLSTPMKNTGSPAK